MKNIVVRAISGLVYVGLIVFAMLAGEWWAVALALFFAGICTVELDLLTEKFDSHTAPGIMLDAVGAMLIVLTPISRFAFLSWIVITAIRGIYEQYINMPDALKRLGTSALAQIYIGIPMACISLFAASNMLHILLGIFSMIWINDTGAYIIGCSFGKHRLFERISPKKSWEGFFGGLLFVIVAALLYSYFCAGFFGMNGFAAWISLALLVVVTGTWGDLMESLIKRSLHVKDSGHIIPGHGGILDRIDSALFAIPLSYVYITILQGLMTI